MSNEIKVCSVEEAELHIRSLWVNVEQLQQRTIDHARRFDTLQTPWWKRIWFAVNGWPWYDLNAAQPKRRPWHRWVRP